MSENPKVKSIIPFEVKIDVEMFRKPINIPVKGTITPISVDMRNGLICVDALRECCSDDLFVMSLSFVGPGQIFDASEQTYLGSVYIPLIKRHTYVLYSINRVSTQEMDRII